MNLIKNQVSYELIKEYNFILSIKLMQKWIDNNDILMYSTNNEGKSVIAEKFIKKSSTRIYKKMTANDSKSYLT